MSSQPQGDLCSLYSQANGEDPIGSATPFDRCLIVEMPLPWPRDVWQASPLSRQIKKTVAESLRGRAPVRLLAIEPEAAQAQAEGSRVFWFQRPQEAGGSPLFAAYDKQEFWVPRDQLAALTAALAADDASAAVREKYALPAQGARDLFVCTQASRDACCGRFGLDVFEQLRDYAAEDWAEDLRVWRVSHLGGHRLAPTLMDMPSGQSFGHLKIELLESLVRRAGDLDALLACYRGWSGMTKYAQIAEREVWRAQGWPWPACRRAAQAADATEDGANRIRIAYETPDGKERGTFQARVETKDQVHTLNNSYTDKYFYIDRYQVRALEHWTPALSP